MKKLTKIKLVNWHIFNNHTISLDGNTLITGENGHGKSTLLDAINYVLSGGAGKFNQAANTNAKRTIESYVRGKTGIEGKEFIRNDDNIVSHIALEFFDDQVGKRFIIGVIFELPLTRNRRGRFYHIQNSPLDEDYFIRDNMVLSEKLFEAAVREKEFTVNFTDTIARSKLMIKSTLGLSNNNYFNLLPRALAFSPINDVSRFVYDFLLPEDKIEIESLQTNIESYREISKLLKIEKEKLELLAPIHEKISVYINNLRIIEYYKCLINEFRIEKIKYLLDKNKKDKIENESKLNEVKNSINIDNANLTNLDTEIRNLENNEVRRTIHELNDKIKLFENYNEELERNISYNFNLLKSEHILSKVLNIKFQAHNLYKEGTFDKFNNEIELYNIQLQDLKFNTAMEQRNINEKKNELFKMKTYLQGEISKLKSNQFTYPYYAETLINILKEELKKEFLVDIEVKPLCELLEIEEVNSTWTNAIEGYLNTQRFDVIVEPKYFDKALHIYEKFKFSRKIHKVGLINTMKLKDYKSLDNSLATKVTCFNEYARQSINMIMGDLICVESIDDLKKYSQAITTTGMTYRNHTARQISEEIWKKPFIGRRAIKQQLRTAIDELSDIDNKLKALSNRIDELTKIDEAISSSRINEFFNIKDYHKQHAENLKQLETSIRERDILYKDNSWIEVQSILELKYKSKEELIHKIDRNKENSYYLKNILNKLRQMEIEHKQQYEDLMKVKTDDYVNDPEYQNLKKVELEKTGHKWDEAIKTVNSKLNELEHSIGKIENEITFRMNDYVSKYDSGQLVANINNYQEFNDLYVKIKNRNIIEFEDKTQKALVDCERTFKEDFLSKLREKINIAQDGFVSLNKTLRNKPFGSEQEIYTFTFGASENPEFRDYYNIIQSNQDYDSRSLFVESLTEKNLILLKQLFDTLTAEDKSEAQVKRIAEYTDYRKYMSYDIKVTNKDNDTYLFSKVFREKSGGETQTPFYVIIASSFHQLTDHVYKNKSSGIIVLFDEAFNNMDESRIEAMMKYYNELNIQLLIAVPPQRLFNILPYVDTTLVLIKDRNTVEVKNYKSIKGGNSNE